MPRPIQSWLARQQRVQTGLRASARAFPLVAGVAVAVCLIDRGAGSRLASPLGEALLIALGVGVTLAIVRLRPSRPLATLARQIDDRRRLGDRVQTVAELEPEGFDRPFGAALLADTRQRLADLPAPLFGRPRFCAVWTLWLGLWLGLPGGSAPPPPRADENPTPVAGPSDSGAPRPQSGGGALAGQPADAAPDRPPTGIDSEPIPPDPIDLDDANRLPKFLTPLRQDGEQHEKEVAVQDREEVAQPEVAPRPPGERRPDEVELPLTENRERVRRTTLPPDRRALLRRYFDRLRK